MLSVASVLQQVRLSSNSTLYKVDLPEEWHKTEAPCLYMLLSNQDIPFYSYFSPDQRCSYHVVIGFSATFHNNKYRFKLVKLHGFSDVQAVGSRIRSGVLNAVSIMWTMLKFRLWPLSSVAKLNASLIALVH